MTQSAWQRLRADPPLAADHAERAATVRQLNLIAILALADAVLLGFLLYASFSDDHDLVSILGPIHGVGFVGLIALCANGAAKERWGWWFPALVVVTLGPPGSLIGDWILRRRIAAAG
jgi:hypothetical protein